MLEDIELNEKNIKRLWKITIYKLNKYKRKFFISSFALLFEIFAYSYILFNVFRLHDSTAPIGTFLLISMTLCFYVVLILINHIFVKRALSHIDLCLIELFLTITIIIYLLYGR